MLVDDSIVRGTTIKRIIGLLREAGAREVHVRLASPKFLYPCFFGTDVPSSENLIACKFDDEGLVRELGVDSLEFLSIENAKRLTGAEREFCTGCFSGEYPCEPPKSKWVNRFESKLSEKQEQD